jgi:hypothetical protein
MGLLARPATETRTRRGGGAKESAAERTPAGGRAAVGLGAASLDTALVIAVGVGETDEDGWVGGGSQGLLLRGFESLFMLFVSIVR